MNQYEFQEEDQDGDQASIDQYQDHNETIINQQPQNNTADSYSNTTINMHDLNIQSDDNAPPPLNEENQLEKQTVMYLNVEVFTTDEASSIICLPYALLKQQSWQNRPFIKIPYFFLINQLFKQRRRITSCQQNHQAAYQNTRQNQIKKKTNVKRMISTNTEYQKLELDFGHFVFQ